MTYDGERVDAPVVDQLEAILRHVADELALWRARATKAEADLKASAASTGGGGAGGAGGSGGAGTGRLDPETRGRVADLEQENKSLRQRVEAARGRVQDLLSRLSFLEEQAREAGGTATGGGGGRAGTSATASGVAPTASSAGGAGAGGGAAK